MICETIHESSPTAKEVAEPTVGMHEFDAIIIDDETCPIDWDKLAEDHAIAYLRGDLATSLPESYTVDEMKAISDGIFSSTAEVESVMREDFQSRTPREQAEMLGLFQQADSEHFDWWMETLVGEMPDAPPKE